MQAHEMDLSAYDKAPMAVISLKKNGALNYYNTAAVTLLEYEPPLRIAGWSITLNTYDESGQRFFLEHSQKPGVNPILLLSPSGKLHRLLAFNLELAENVVIILFDGTDFEFQQTQELVTSAIIESSDDAIISTLLDGHIISWNPAATALFGYTEAEALGQHINIIIPEERLDEEELIVDRIRQGGKVNHYETLRINRTGQAIPVSLTVSALRNEGRVIGVANAARDISVQVQDREQLQHYATQLEELVQQRTQSLEETVTELQQAKLQLTASLAKEQELNRLKSRFVSMASHEFRTPLAGIQLSASLAEKYLAIGQSSPIANQMKKIKNAVGALTGILGDFLSLEKLENGKVGATMTAFDLKILAKSVAEELRPLAKPGQKIIFRHSGQSAMVILDRALLQNCLINLLSNAIKYSGPNTRIDLRTTVSATGCTIKVNDQGIGIPAQDQKSMFEAFFRANNTTGIQGTGLGLNIVSQYVALMGGKISFESEENKGSIFLLTFTQKDKTNRFAD